MKNSGIQLFDLNQILKILIAIEIFVLMMFNNQDRLSTPAERSKLFWAFYSFGKPWNGSHKDPSLLIYSWAVVHFEEKKYKWNISFPLSLKLNLRTLWYWSNLYHILFLCLLYLYFKKAGRNWIFLSKSFFSSH